MWGQSSRICTAEPQRLRDAEGAAGREALAPESSWLAHPREWSGDHKANPIHIARWKTSAEETRCTATLSDRWVLALNLAPIHLRLRTATRSLFAGTLSPGSLFALPPGESLHAVQTGRCDIVHLYVEHTFFEARRAALAPSGPAPGAGFSIVRDGLCVQLLATLIRDDAPVDELYLQSVAQAVLSRYLFLHGARARVPALPAWRVKRVRALVEERLSDGLRLVDLAEAAGLSRMHFAAQFKAATGYRPHEYLLSRRIEASKRLLAQTTLPLAEVALSVGFQAQAHFTTVFRQVVGETPGRWRRSHRAGD